LFHPDLSILLPVVDRDGKRFQEGQTQ
jgi:hypothetical protein